MKYFRNLIKLYKNLFYHFLDMGSRNVDSGHSSSRNANQDVDRVEVSQNRRRDASNEESSDSSSSANERGRKKEKSSGTKRKEQIQGNSHFLYYLVNHYIFSRSTTFVTSLKYDTFRSGL